MNFLDFDCVAPNMNFMYYDFVVSNMNFKDFVVPNVNFGRRRYPHRIHSLRISAIVHFVIL